MTVLGTHTQHALPQLRVTSRATTLARLDSHPTTRWCISAWRHQIVFIIKNTFISVTQQLHQPCCHVGATTDCWTTCSWHDEIVSHRRLHTRVLPALSSIEVLLRWFIYDCSHTVKRSCLPTTRWCISAWRHHEPTRCSPVDKRPSHHLSALFFTWTEH